MKKLYIESHFDATPDEIWDVFESDAFRERLSEHTGVSSELLEEKEQNGVIVRKLKFTTNSDLPKIAAKALGTKRLSYEQTNRFDRGNSRLDWNVVLPNLSDRVKVSGVTSIAPDGSGSKRTVDGTIEVKMRLIGGQIEKVVADRFSGSMTRAVELAQELLDERNQA